ncbi:MAG: alpha/beta hydrolase [Candidatus Binatia bacterium]
MELIHTIYEPSGAGPHPAVLTLHGRGANAFDLLGLAPHLCDGRFLVICPQGPLETPIGPGVSGYSWYPLSMGGPPDVPAILSAREKLQRFLEQALGRYPIDAKKLVALGFSQGGVMAYTLALTMPERFAAFAALSSWLPVEAFQQISLSDGCRSLPTLVQHGARDGMIQVSRARDSVEKLREWQVPVTYREYDMDHEITPSNLSDLSAWLEEKVLSPISIAG